MFYRELVFSSSTKKHNEVDLILRNQRRLLSEKPRQLRVAIFVRKQKVPREMREAQYQSCVI